MTESEQRVSFPAGGGTSAQPSQPAEGGKGEAPAPLTKAEVLQLLNEQAENLRREMQSRTDKSESRVDKKIKAELAALNQAVQVQREAGMEITDQQLAAARQRIYDRAYTQPEESQPEPQVPQRQPSQPAAEQGQGDVAAFVNQQMDEILAEYGVNVTAQEAEAAGLTGITNPRQFLKKFEEYAANKARQSSTPAAARIPAGGTSAAGNLQAAFEAERAKIPRGQEYAMKLQALRMKYRAQGLKDV